jgi:hypothetical protein
MTAVPRSGTEERNAAIPLRMTVGWGYGDGGKQTAERLSIAGLRMTLANCVKARRAIFISTLRIRSQALGMTTGLFVCVRFVWKPQRCD